MKPPLRTPAFAVYKGHDKIGKAVYTEPIPASHCQQKDDRTWLLSLEWAPPHAFTLEALTLLTEHRNVMCTEWMGDTTLQQAGQGLPYPYTLAAKQSIQLTLTVNIDGRLP